MDSAECGGGVLLPPEPNAPDGGWLRRGDTSTVAAPLLLLPLLLLLLLRLLLLHPSLLFQPHACATKATQTIEHTR